MSPVINESVKNLLFDFGGVIIDIDYRAVLSAFESLGLKNAEAFYQHDAHSQLVESFEEGLLEEDVFRDAMIKEIGKDISAQQFDDAWNAIIKTIPPQRIELLKRLAENYNLYLLSNTNIIHYRKYMADFESVFGYSFRDLFQKAYYSHEIKMRKPNLEIYQYVLTDAGIEGEETLFIDDSVINIEAAEKAGLKVLYKPQHEDVCKYFEGKII